jgi:hypothetical protein
MKSMKKGLIILMFLGGLISCDPRSPETMDRVQSPAEVSDYDVVEPTVQFEKNGLVLSEAPSSFNYPDARISIETPDLSKNLNPGNVNFKFKVDNFELGTQTPGAEHRKCANSEEGQHIHYILNNEPYTAHYEPAVAKQLPEGKHLLLAFLSRSYHESIKTNSAYLLEQINVGNAAHIPDYNLKGQHLFYSRPKGDYEGEDIEHLLVDFYLVNTSISEKGNKVRLVIDGNTEFLLTRWVPYKVTGLSPGEHTFRIQLIDNAGLLVPGPFNDSGDRKITLKANGEAHHHHHH